MTASRNQPAAHYEGPALPLPWRDLHSVVLPLASLEVDVAREHVLAECPQHDLGLGQLLDGLAQGLGQLLDAQSHPLVV